jgi:hypothetical protein
MESAILCAQVPGSASSDGDDRLPVSSEGRALRAFLDGMAVDRYWLRSNERILWETGEPSEVRDGKILEPLAKDETHCSAFVAAAALRLGIYILRPPEHSHVLLANAQFDWLPSPKAVNSGWSRVATPLDAQRRANAGYFVVAVVKNSDPMLAGHIAVIAPCEKSAPLVMSEGPEVCQAGFTNYRATSLQNGFSLHVGAWEPGGSGTVRFFSNSADPKLIGRVDRDASR